MGLSALIGALRVSLGLDTAAYSKGFKTAERDMDRFRKVAVRAGAAIGAALSGVAIGTAIRGAVNYADALSKAAQRAGVAAEALSRLEYAGRFADISLETLTGSLQKLSKSMADAVLSKTSTSATAFKALGIEVTGANGALRNSDAVFGEIAERFARMENGATKTSLAMMLFGKSGAALIPMLNEGSDGLRRFADESDRTGNTIDGKTGRAAERFNDTLTAVQGTMTGLTNKLMVAVLPAMQSFANTLASPEFARAAETLVVNVVGALDKITIAVTGLINLLGDLSKKMSEAFAPAGARGSTVSNAEIEKQIQSWQSDVDQTYSRIARNRALNEQAALRAELERRRVAAEVGAENLGASRPSFDFRGFLNGNDKRGADEAATPDSPIDFTSLTDKTEAFKDAFAGIAPLLETVRDPFQQLQADMDALGGWLNQNMDQWDTYAQGVVRAHANMVAGVADGVAGVVSVMSSLFRENKALAIASAVVDGIASVAKTLAQYGVTPMGLAAAGVAAATAASNVASLLSTTESTRSMPGNAAPNVSAPAPQPGSAINLTIRGSGMINVDDFADQLTKGIADGGYQNLVKVMRTA